jgi:hypothetical protein
VAFISILDVAHRFLSHFIARSSCFVVSFWNGFDMIEQLIYVSEGTSQDNVKAGIEIAKFASEFNSSVGISGILVVHKAYFMQCIEGERAIINQLFQKICQDRRHKNIQLTSYRSIEKRSFSDWSMRAFEENLENRHFYFSFSSSLIFNPYSLSSKACLVYLRDLADFNQNALQKGR